MLREKVTDLTDSVIRDRKAAISDVPSTCLRSEKLHAQQLWAQKLHSAILCYGRAENESIVHQLMKLPRELRDTVYKHLWEPDESHDPGRDLLYWWDFFEEQWFRIGNDLYAAPWVTTDTTWLRPPYFVYQAFLPQSFVREVLLLFKDMVGKDLRLQGKRLPVAEFALAYDSLEDFVQKDIFGVGLTMQELVQNLDMRINVYCDALINEEGSCDGASEIQVNGSRLHADDSKDLLSDSAIRQLETGITALISIPYSERVIVHDGQSRCLQTRPRIVTLIIRQEDSFHVRISLVACLKAVARAYHGLEEKDFVVNVQYRSEDIGFDVIFEKDAWSWSLEDWESFMQEKNRSKVEPQIHFREAQRKVWEDIKTHLFDLKETCL